jgi:hypothetical protein
MTAGRFSIGQKVRCVREHFSGDLIVGQTYVVAAPNQDEPTCTWIEGNSYGYFSDHFVAVTDAESVQPADECTCLDQPQWCAFCIRRIEAWPVTRFHRIRITVRGGLATITDSPGETDDQLDSRNVNPIHTIKPPAHVHCYMAPDWVCSCGHTWKQKEQAEGVARALRRLCDGAEWRMGCADYEPGE